MPVGASGWLSLSATPVFALMALLTAMQGAGPIEALCSGVRSGWPLGGMAPMYALMSAFHAPPWLRLVASGRARR